VTIRPGHVADLRFLEAMLFEAFFWDPTAPRPSLEAFRRDPEFVKWLADWGRRGDRVLIAEDRSSPIGAAWFRLWTAELHSYGFVDASTPEVGLGVSVSYRRHGVGRTLLERLIDKAAEDGFPALSLSVSPLNFARALYESLGFRRVGTSGTSWTLRLILPQA
jgi:ribosomal protein S18 acetylase RimI-like enzyme